MYSSNSYIACVDIDFGINSICHISLRKRIVVWCALLLPLPQFFSSLQVVVVVVEEEEVDNNNKNDADDTIYDICRPMYVVFYCCCCSIWYRKDLFFEIHNVMYIYIYIRLNGQVAQILIVCMSSNSSK